MTGPYGVAAANYWAAGWRGILPLPARRKKNPPAGFTGSGGIYPSYPDIQAWIDGPEAGGNICLRMPANVIGLDVDAYGDKDGATTLKLAQSLHGRLPATWRTTSRDDGISGIRFYRVPEGLAWPGEIGPATEIIQARHRYAIVSPSIHPEGGTYRWIGPDGVTSTTIPDPDELPNLPDAWITTYTGGVEAVAVTRNVVKHDEAVGWLIAQPTATKPPCARMTKIIDNDVSRLREGDAHGPARDTALRIIRLTEEEHRGGVEALAAARQAFLVNTTNPNRALLGKNRRTTDEAAYEWGELVASAVGLVTANPTGMATCDCDGQLTGAITGTTHPITVDGATALAPTPAPATDVTVAVTAAEADDNPLLAKLVDGGTFVLDAPDDVPALWGDGDDVLWAEGECLMLAGPPGVGKTTLTGQVLRGLIGLQKQVLGLPVRPAAKVLYLAMDRPAQIRRGLRRAFTPGERAVLESKVDFWQGPPPGDVAKHDGLLVSLAQLADADVVIIDSLKDAAIGLTEDDTAAAYNRARQKALAAGVQIMELHHMVKRGANGNKPTELADVYGSTWLTAGAGSVVLLWGAAGDPIVEMRHLKQPAAEVGPYQLRHDHDHGRTVIFHETDLLMMVAAAGRSGMTAQDAARAIERAEKPTSSHVEKARRKLDKLVTQGLIEKASKPREGWSGGKAEAVYVTSESQSRPNHATPSTEPNHDPITPITKTHVSPGQPNHDPITPNPAQGPITLAPPFIGGRRVGPDETDPTDHPEPDPPTTVINATTPVDCNRCGRETNLAIANVTRGLCMACYRENP